ncbi:MAG: N-acetyltransferase [Pseudomonadota bacterium]
MKYLEGHNGPSDGLIALFGASFTASEGPDEGQVIAKLVRDLIELTPVDDLAVFSIEEHNELIASIMFTPLVFRDDKRSVALLSPVAVAPDHQRQGHGQALLTHGLAAIRRKGIDVAITYGNPAYYSRVGFKQITASPPQSAARLACPASVER